MRFGTGYRPDPQGTRPTIGHLRMGASPLPLSASLLSNAPPVMNQNGSSSCTGHSVATGLAIALQLAWIPSPAEIYRNGRAIDRFPKSDGSFDPLTDEGAMPSQVFRAVNGFGIRPMVPLADRFSDVVLATVNVEPKLGDLEAEALNVIVGDYGIYSTGEQRSDDIARSIANGKPVTCAVPGGSDAWQNYAGGVLGPTGTAIDHYVAVVAYDVDVSGKRVFVIRNSWGVTYGEVGNVRVSVDAIQEFTDIVALDVRRAA